MPTTADQAAGQQAGSGIPPDVAADLPGRRHHHRNIVPGMAAPAYSREVKEAARTLHIEGLSTSEIQSRLEAGTAGLPYTVRPGLRTIGAWRRAWRREGVREGFRVRSGEETDIEEAQYRRVLALARETADQVDRALAEGTASLDLMRQLEIAQRMIESTRAKRRIAAKQDRGEKLTEQEGGEKGDDGGSKLALLMKAEERRQQNGGPGIPTPRQEQGEGERREGSSEDPEEEEDREDREGAGTDS